MQNAGSERAKEDQSSSFSAYDINGILECRICLEQQSGISSENLVSPCNCAGSLKFVHAECLEKWIVKIVEVSKKDVEHARAFICCEICKCKIEFSAKSQLVCKNLAEIRETFSKKYKLFIALTLLLIINLAFFAALLNYLLFVGLRTLKQNNVVLVSLIISGQVIFSIVAVVTVGAIVNVFFFKKNLIIVLSEPPGPHI